MTASFAFRHVPSAINFITSPLFNCKHRNKVNNTLQYYVRSARL
jgi:hypothetical protein